MQGGKYVVRVRSGGCQWGRESRHTVPEDKHTLVKDICAYPTLDGRRVERQPGVGRVDVFGAGHGVRGEKPLPVRKGSNSPSEAKAGRRDRTAGRAQRGGAKHLRHTELETGAHSIVQRSAAATRSWSGRRKQQDEIDNHTRVYRNPLHMSQIKYRYIGCRILGLRLCASNTSLSAT